MTITLFERCANDPQFTVIKILDGIAHKSIVQTRPARLKPNLAGQPEFDFDLAGLVFNLPGLVCVNNNFFLCPIKINQFGDCGHYLLI
jgi:hypothetical protein